MIKTSFHLHEGPLDAGLNTFTLPSMQGYAKGVFQVKVANKTTDGTVGLAIAEFINKDDGDGILVDSRTILGSLTEGEWRLPVDVPGLWYRVEVFRNASAADAEIRFVAGS